MEKLVVIINGAGGAGKDTVCEIAAQKYAVTIRSSIDPIKKIAVYGGWNPSDKSLPARKLLSDLKRAFTLYNDWPTRYLMEQYAEFLHSDREILFVHIREAEEIEKFRAHIRETASDTGQPPARCVTLLVKSAWTAESYGNASDDGVENYSYDFIYHNDKTMAELREDFLHFFTEKIISAKS